MLHSSRGAAHITDHPETLKLTHTITVLSELLRATGSTSELYLGINCNIYLDILKFCMLIGQLIRNANHLILTYKIVYLKWTNLKIYYFPECLLCRPDGLRLISKPNTKNLDGICASVTPAVLCETGNKDRRVRRSSGASWTRVHSPAEKCIIEQRRVL